MGVRCDGTWPDANVGLANLVKNYFVLKEQLCFVGQAQYEVMESSNAHLQYILSWEKITQEC